MKLRFKDVISYSMGDLSYSLIYIFLNAFILAFLTEAVHMPAVRAGLVVLMANVCDAVTDPIVGYLADRGKNRGRNYKTWIKIFTIPAAISFILCFFIPEMSGIKTMVYCYIIYLVWTLLKTCVQVPFSAMSAALTDDSSDRVKVGAVRDWMSNVGGVLISVVAVLVVGHFGSGSVSGYRYAAIVIGLFSIIGYYIAAFATKETYYVVDSNKVKSEEGINDYSIIQALTALLTSKYAVLLIAFVFLGQMAMGMRMSLMPYYCTYYLKDPSLSVMSVNMTLSYVIPIIGIAFVPILIRIIGRKTVMCIGGSLMILAGVISLVARQNFILADLSGAMVGCGICFQMSVVWGAMPDTADYVYKKRGVPAAGILTAFITLAMAVGSGLCSFLASRILNLIGYEATASVQMQTVGNGVYTAFGLMPVIFGILMVICAGMFRLDGKQNAG